MVASKCYSPDGTTYNEYSISADFIGYWSYIFSEVNRFTVIGCNHYAWLTSTTKYRNVSTGCIIFCARREEVVGDKCNVSNRRSFAPCTYAFIGEAKEFKFNGATGLINGTYFVERTEATVPIVLEWAIGNLNSSVKKGMKEIHICLLAAKV
ncbi:hypothetical protein Tco_0217576 [Tanacetum coccineum]